MVARLEPGRSTIRSGAKTPTVVLTGNGESNLAPVQTEDDTPRPSQEWEVYGTKGSVLW